MKKLWQKNWRLDKVIEAFETKDDLLLDQRLIPYDIQGSLAHAKSLGKIGILSSEELKKLETGLHEILKHYKEGKFVLRVGDEDMHTKIENYLTENYGQVGKKIHTARSRNDQILTSLRLYTKAKMMQIHDAVTSLATEFESLSKKYRAIPMPGYTHMQKAMPSTVGLWVESFKDSLKDDITSLEFISKLIDQSPLGTAAGYGVSISLDRKLTADILGFSKVQKNPIYTQQSRGKFEAAIVACLVQLLMTINKFASDVLLFTTQEFNFLHINHELTTGSSIMPQKRNIDIAELLRSKVHIVLGNYTQIVSLSSNLVSGYNRDLQDSKKPLLESLDIVLQSIEVTGLLVKGIRPNKKSLKRAMTEDLFATTQVLELVKKGKSFREAYQVVSTKYEKGGEK